MPSHALPQGEAPFLPGEGQNPTYLAGRQGAVAEFKNRLEASPRPPLNAMVLGPSGVGKTVLLNRFESEARSAGWAVVRAELGPEENSTRGLGQYLAPKFDTVRYDNSARIRTVARFKALLRWIHWDPGYGIGAFSLGDPEASRTEIELGDAIHDATKACVSNGRSGLLVILDEGHEVWDDDENQSYPLTTLLRAVSGVQRSLSPVALVVAGFPSLARNLAAAQSYAARMFSMEADLSGQLLDTDVRDGLLFPLSKVDCGVDDEVLDALLDEIEGYPFFIQIWGEALWQTAQRLGVQTIDGVVLDEARQSAHETCERFRRRRLSGLPDDFQLYLLDLAHYRYPFHRRQLEADAAAMSRRPILEQLRDSGMLLPDVPGQLRFAIPDFFEFLDREASR